MKIGDLVRLGEWRAGGTEGEYIVFTDKHGIIVDYDMADLFDVLCEDGEIYVYAYDELEVIPCK